MNRWIGILLIISVVINSVTLILLTKGNNTTPTIVSEAPRVQPYDEKMSSNYSAFDIKQLELLEQLGRLNSEVKKIEKLLTDKEKSTPAESSPVDSQKTRSIVENANRVGMESVEQTLLGGSLDQEGVHNLRQVMADMSSEEHHKALQKLIIAINNGDLVLQPGTIL
ncbi:MAG: hypothetical protein OQK04_08380 [Kangiellaceae bacterium]|nr:hypothetical protein [Kangiellaceae bacterium]MCW8998715.1 hypothetical protein [Kangiellaceae bacterium]